MPKVRIYAEQMVRYRADVDLTDEELQELQEALNDDDHYRIADLAGIYVDVINDVMDHDGFDAYDVEFELLDENGKYVRTLVSEDD